VSFSLTTFKIFIMNATHFHLLLNHFPIIGTLIGTIILGYGFIAKEIKIKILSAYVIAAMALIAVPVYLTGEPAEETVEGISGISETSIELHEEAAEFAIVIMSITGFLALIGIIASIIKPTLTHKVFYVLLILSIFSFAAMARVGYLGGKIRHTELNENIVKSAPSNNPEEREEED
jgi:uncharacterized membrane protein